MPAKVGKERPLLELFLAQYEGGIWLETPPDWVDEHTDGGVEVIAAQSNGTRLAIEHTLVQPFPEDRETGRNLDYFFRIRDDQTLIIREREIWVGIPVDVLRNGAGWDFASVAADVHSWMRESCAIRADGSAFHDCPTTGHTAGSTSIRLHIRQVPSSGSSGHVVVYRYGDLHVVKTVEKALRTKLVKLKNASADRRILLLERDAFVLSEEEIVATVEGYRSAFPDLVRIDEVWIVETVGSLPGQEWAEFKRYSGNDVHESFGFFRGTLIWRSRDGMPMPLTPDEDSQRQIVMSQ